MKKGLLMVTIVGLVALGMLVFNAPSHVSVPPAAAEFLGHQVIMGGGTAVLLDNGDLYDLTMNGWVRSGHLPEDVSVGSVKVVLDGRRIVEFDGTAWIWSNDRWKRISRPSY